MSDVATASKDKAKPTERLGPDNRPLRVDPKWCVWNYQGQIFSEYHVTLPLGATFQDLNDHRELWQTVQGSPSSLKVLDRLVVTDFDRTWLCDCVVVEATAASITLGGYRKIDLPKRHNALPSTEDLEIRWFGNGYAAIRKKDGLRVTEIVPSLSVAVHHMHARYSRPV